MSTNKRSLMWRALAWGTMAHMFLIVVVMVAYGMSKDRLFGDVDFSASAFGVAYSICTDCWPLLVPAVLGDILLVYICLRGRRSPRADDLFLAVICLFVTALIVPIASLFYADQGMKGATKPGGHPGTVSFLPLQTDHVLKFPLRFNLGFRANQYVRSIFTLLQLWFPYVLLMLIPETWLRCWRSFWRHRHGWAWFYGMSCGSVVVCFAVFSIWLYVFRSSAPQMADDRIDWIRREGNPTNMAEIEVFYRIPPDVVDQTAEWKAMLEVPCLANGRLSYYDVTIVNGKRTTNVRQRLETYAAELERLRTLAVQGGYFRRELDFLGSINKEIPNLDYVSDAYVALSSDTHLQAGDGNRYLAGQSLLGLLNVTELSAYEPLCDSLLTRYGRTERFVHVLEELLPSTGFTETELRPILQSLQRADYESSLERSLKAERAVFIAMFRDKSRLSTPRAGRDAELVGILDGFQMAIELSQRPWAEAYPLLYGHAVRNRDRLHSPIFRLLLPASPMMPKFFRDQTTVANCRAYNSLGQLMIAVHMYHSAAGQLPRTLEEAVRGVLPDVPLDPFDGKPMRYKLVDDHMCVIWSIGDDGIDNGGQLPDIVVTLDYLAE